MSENVIEKNGKSYKVIDPDIYLLNGWEGIVKAEKREYITARMAEGGKMFSVMTADGKGETQEVAKLGDWIATRAYEDGTPYVDEHGNTNSWLMSAETLAMKYNISQELENGESVFTPRGGEQEFMCVQEDIALSVPWGENGKDILMTVDKGGYLNVTDPDDVYGIAENEFNETYRITETVRSEVDKDIYEASGGTSKANVNAIIEKLAEHGIKASVDYDVDIEEKNFAMRVAALECINGDRSDRLIGHDTTVLKAELPNGMNVKIITDEVPDRAAVAECQAPVSEAHHHENASEGMSEKAYRPEIDYRITHIQGRIGDVAEKVAEAGRTREITYGELISASVQKYFPEKADEIADSLLVRSDLTAGEKEMLGEGGYSPNKTIIAPGETMARDETEALIRDVEECKRTQETIRNVLEHGDAELEKITEADPRTQEERVSTVKDCQRFLDTVLKGPADKQEHEYGKGFLNEYHELYANRVALVAALSSDSPESCAVVTEATERYKDMLLDKAEKEYNDALDGGYIDFLEDKIGMDYATDYFDIYQYRKDDIKEMAVAPASYIVQNHYASAIESVRDIQKDVSKDIITQLSADTQGVTHEEVSADFNNFAVKDLDSAQLLADSDGNHSLQVTYSDNHCFNAIKVDIPVEEFDDPASAVSAATKYSQTKEEFEKEMPDLSYEETYASKDMSYVEESESLGEVRYDDEIDIDEANAILGVEDEPEEEIDEKTGENRHQEYDNYDDIEL